MILSAYQVSQETLVHAAVLCYAAGFLCRDQIALRCAILTGSSFYLAYYWTVDGGPLWDAFAGSLLIASANLAGLGSLIHSRMTFTIARADRPLHEALGALEPGIFRQLMRIGERRTARKGTILTREGETPDRLHFVLSGHPVVIKSGRRFAIDPHSFVGEVSWMLGVPASATVELPEGADYLSWRRDRLDRLMRRKPRAKQALEALIAQDMARKVAAGQRAEAERSGDPPARAL